MKTIRADFHRFSDLSFSDLIGTIGCYVIWDSQAKAKASYIGSGVVLARINEHHKRFALPLQGYIAITDNEIEARVIEAVMIALAINTDRGASHNDAPGAWSHVKKFSRGEKVRAPRESCAYVNRQSHQHLPRA